MPWQKVIADAELPRAGKNLFIALDVDGTLLHHDTSVSPRVIAAVQTHLAAGTQLVICTGRGIAGAQRAMQQIGIDSGYAVCANGAITIAVGDTPVSVPTQEIANAVKLSEPPVQLIKTHTFNSAKEIEILSRVIPNARIAVESVHDIRRLNMEFPIGELTGDSQIVPLSDLAHSQTTRLTIRVPEMSAHELLQIVNQLGLNGVEYAIGWSAWLDISPAGVSKATGLQDVIDVLGISQENTVTIGDSGNDCKMLQWARLGIAMGNAPQYVQEYADAVTTDVDHDGAALVLEALL